MCPVCGLPFRTLADAPTGGPSDHPCARCLRHPPHFRRARARAIYRPDADQDPLRHALHRYKYGRDVSLAPLLGGLLHDMAPTPGDVDLVVPVPLHLARLRWRGFNQAQLLAAPLARAAGLRIDPHVLARVRPTTPQVGLPERERRSNVRGAFAVRDAGRVAGRRLLLVDDVYTTGATVNECARVLRRAGARSVDVLVLARATVA